MPLLTNNVAKSPFKRWPGTLTFPEFLSLPNYQRWVAWLSEQVEIKSDASDDDIQMLVSDAFKLRVVQFEYSNGNGGEPDLEPGAYSNRYLEASLMFGTLKLKNLPKGALKDPMNNDKMPFQVAIWIGDAGKEWLERELSFPGYRDRVVAEPEGEQA